MSEYPKTYLMASTLGPNEFYFENTKKYLESKGIEAKNIVPATPDLKEYEIHVSEKVEEEEKNIVLAGWSFAGNVAGEVGKKYQKKVGKVIFIDCVPEWRYQPLKDRILMKFLTSLPEKYTSKILGSKLMIKSLLNEMIKRDIDKEIKEKILYSSYVLRGEWLLKAVKSGMKYTNIDSIKLVKDLQKKDVDIYMIYSSDDTRNYIENSGIKKILPEENFFEIENCGHLIMFEAPEEFHEILYKIITL